MEICNWARNVIFSTDTLHRPTTVAQLQEIVASGSRLRAFGSGHSFNRVADTTGDLVSVRNLTSPLEIDAAAGIATLAAGSRYGEVTTALQEAGWALHNLGSLPHISVAGACSTGTHGSGSTNANLSNAAVAVEFIRADGELERLSRAEHPESFPGAVLALGCLGIITRLALRIEPTFDVRQDVYLDLPFTALVDDVAAVMDTAYSVSCFTTWRRPDVVDTVWRKSRVDMTGAGPAAPTWLGAHLADAPQHPIPGVDPAAATQQLGVPGPWNARLPSFRLEFTPSSGDEVQSEWLLPREHAVPALLALRELAGPVSGAAHIQEIRTIAADDLWLSPSYERETFALHFTWVADERVFMPVVDAVERALAPFDPRPHWGKVFTTPPAEVAARYPRLAEFRALVGRYDPERKFANDFVDRYLLEPRSSTAASPPEPGRRAPP